MLNAAGVETTKGHFLKALGQYRISSEERKVVRQEKNFEKMSEKIHGLTNELNYLEHKYLEKNNLVEVRKSEVDGLKNNLRDLQDRLETTKTKIRLKDKALQENEIYTEKLKVEVDSLKSELFKFEEEFGVKKKGYDWQDCLITELEEEKDKLQKEYNNVKKDFDNSTEVAGKNNNTINAIKVDIQNLKKSIEHTTDNIYRTKTSIKENELKYHEYVKQLNELKEVLALKMMPILKFRVSSIV